MGGSSPAVMYGAAAEAAEGRVSFFCIMHGSRRFLPNANLGRKLSLSKSAGWRFY